MAKSMNALTIFHDSTAMYRGQYSKMCACLAMLRRVICEMMTLATRP